MYMKICVVGDVLDVITCAEIKKEIFKCYNFTGGRIFHFPIDFEWALQQCSATALPVMVRCITDFSDGQILQNQTKMADIEIHSEEDFEADEEGDSE